jgi:hypothetical protein
MWSEEDPSSFRVKIVMPFGSRPGCWRSACPSLTLSMVALSFGMDRATQPVSLLCSNALNIPNRISVGVLLDNAQELLKQPGLTESDLLRRFKVTIRDAHRYGLTSIHDAGLDPASLAFFKR